MKNHSQICFSHSQNGYVLIQWTQYNAGVTAWPLCMPGIHKAHLLSLLFNGLEKHSGCKTTLNFMEPPQKVYWALWKNEWKTNTHKQALKKTTDVVCILQQLGGSSRMRNAPTGVETNLILGQHISEKLLIQRILINLVSLAEFPQAWAGLETRAFTTLLSCYLSISKCFDNNTSTTIVEHSTNDGKFQIQGCI